MNPCFVKQAAQRPQPPRAPRLPPRRPAWCSAVWVSTAACLPGEGIRTAPACQLACLLCSGWLRVPAAPYPDAWLAAWLAARLRSRGQRQGAALSSGPARSPVPARACSVFCRGPLAVNMWPDRDGPGVHWLLEAVEPGVDPDTSLVGLPVRLRVRAWRLGAWVGTCTVGLQAAHGPQAGSTPGLHGCARCGLHVLPRAHTYV